MKKTVSILKTVLLFALCAALIFSAACEKKPQGGEDVSAPGSDNTDTVTPVSSEQSEEYDYTTFKDNVTPELSAENEVRILVWGDYTVGGNNMSGFLKELAQYGGYNSTITTYYYDNSANGDTYNLYELFNFEGTNIGDIKSSGTSQKIAEKLNEGIDYFVIISGRDRTLYNEASAEKSIKAAVALEGMLQAVNPEGKIVLVAGPAYVSGFDKLGVKTSVGHLAKINEYAEKMAAALKTPIIARVGNAFMTAQDNGADLYSVEFANQPSEAGSYLTACVIYARIFGKAPSGDSALASIDLSTVAKLQMFSSWSALAVSPASSYLYATPVDSASYQLPVGSEVKILLWGDYTVGGNNMSEIFKALAASGGYNATISTYFYNNYGKNETYNLYELFSFSGDSCTIKETGTAQKISEKIAEGLDYLVVVAGRDKALYNETTASKNIKAAAALEQMLLAVNPNAKLVVIAGPAYTDGLDAFKVSTSLEHLIKINGYADKMVNALTAGMPARVGNAFMLSSDWGISLYDDRDVNMPNVSGSYLTACVLYARLFGVSPVGLPVAIEGIPNEVISNLQLAAEQTAIGITPVVTEPADNTPVDYQPSTDPTFVDTDTNTDTDTYTDTTPATTEPTVTEPVEEIDTTDYDAYDFTKVLDEPTPVKMKGEKLNILLWGDYTIIGNSMGRMLKLLGDAGGYNLKVSAIGYNNYKSSTYNLYELFKFNSDDTVASFATGTTAVKLQNKMNSKSSKLDYLVLLSGRDRTLSKANNRDKRSRAAMVYLEEILKKSNPDAKVVLFAPEPYPVGYGTTTKLFDDTMVAKKHLYKINEYADSALAVMKDAFAARVGNAFMQAQAKGLPVYDADFPIQPSLHGSYLSSCVLYARILGISPVGLDYYGGLTEDEAKALQLVAQESVFGKDYKMPELGTLDTKTAITPVKAPLSKEKTLSMLSWGDYLLYGGTFSAHLRNLMKEGGYTASLRVLGYNNSNSATATYNLYELFNYDSSNKISSWKTSTSPKTIQNFAGDIFIFNSGRDRTLNSETNAKKTLLAYEAIVTQLKENNPDMMIILFSPESPLSGFSTYSPASLTTFEFNQDINDYADRMANFVDGIDPIVARVGDAFEECALKGITGLYMDDTSRFPSDFGFYLEASVVYSAITNETTIGYAPPAGASKEYALELQKASHKAVFGADADGSHAGALNVVAITSKLSKDNGVMEMFESITNKAGFSIDLVDIVGDSDIAGFVNSTAFRNKMKYDLTKFDVILVEAGRDAVLYDKTARDKEIAAIAEIEKLALENNPEAKVVVIAPFARQNTKGYNFKAVCDANKVKTKEQYSALIGAYADELVATLKNPSYVISVNDVFLKTAEKGIQVYANRTSDFSSDAGAYAIATSLFARVFKGSPVGVNYYGNITEASAKTIQNVVYDVVFGE